MSENTELQIIEYRPTAAALAELGERYKGVVYPVTETKGMADAKAARAELRGYRVDLEKLRKELKAPALERSRLIDDDAKRITSALVEIEDPIDAQIKAEETRKENERKAADEAERKAVEAIQTRIAEIRNWPSRFIGCQSTAIGAELENLNSFDDEEFGLYAGMAKQAHAECMATLETMLGKALAHEQEQARQESERVERARVQAEERKKIEADRAELASLQAEQAERMRLEREAHEAELNAAREESERIEAENRKARAEAEAKAQGEREAESKRLVVQFTKERNKHLMARLYEIQAQDTAIENKLMQAYQMGRKDMAAEYDGDY
jgi:colicin import membrane protein